jgi:hypothetical protein
MPEPISSSRREDTYGYDDANGTCGPPATTRAPAPPPTKSEVRDSCALDIEWHAPCAPMADYSGIAKGAATSSSNEGLMPWPSLATDDNARRNASQAPAPYARAGVTSSGMSAHAGVALVKGSDQASGVQLEVMSASAQVGIQNEAQAAAFRITVPLDPGAISVTVDAATAKVNAGVVNGDGSVGMNAGAAATLIGAEVTLGGATSVTVGGGIGVGTEASLGIRDSDDDGNPEVCIKLGVGLVAKVAVGGCIEFPEL